MARSRSIPLEDKPIPSERLGKPTEAGQVLIRASAINQMDRLACLAHWQTVFGRPPPKYLSPQFMKRVLIWELQVRVLGGVSKQTERRFRKIAEGKAPQSIAKPGSHLVREWNGRTYQVSVISDGYVMDGRTYRSLSAVARHITGAHWSGPRFFGVS